MRPTFIILCFMILAKKSQSYVINVTFFSPLGINSTILQKNLETLSGKKAESGPETVDRWGYFSPPTIKWSCSPVITHHPLPRSGWFPHLHSLELGFVWGSRMVAKRKEEL